MKKAIIGILIVVLFITCKGDKEKYSYKEKVILSQKVIDGDLKALKEYEEIMSVLLKKIDKKDPNAVKEMEEWSEIMAEALGITIIVK